jgi:fatty acid desaturase
MTTTAEKTRIAWYRVPLKREDLSRLNRRSDLLGFAQTLGFLAVLTALAGSAIYGAAHHWPWPILVLLVFANGTCWHFLAHGFHELIHDSVFKTRWLNGFFLRIFAFLGQHNHHHYGASHVRHHVSTLHPPDDLEVVLPQKFFWKHFWRNAIIEIDGIRWRYRSWWLLSRGQLSGQWEHILFDNEPEKKRKMVNWTRIMIAGQLAILVVSIIMHWWIVPLVTTFAPLIGGWLFWLVNNTQHAGLKDNSDDFRECVRTIYLNPFLQFLYWHMNYHCEHHMYAAVPCYRLGALHRLIKADMPECPRGLYATWKLLMEIQKKQEADPTYQYVPPMPPRRSREGVTAFVAGEPPAMTPLLA